MQWRDLERVRLDDYLDNSVFSAEIDAFMKKNGYRVVQLAEKIRATDEYMAGGRWEGWKTYQDGASNCVGRLMDGRKWLARRKIGFDPIDPTDPYHEV